MSQLLLPCGLLVALVGAAPVTGQGAGVFSGANDNGAIKFDFDDSETSGRVFLFGQLYVGDTPPANGSQQDTDALRSYYPQLKEDDEFSAGQYQSAIDNVVGQGLYSVELESGPASDFTVEPILLNQALLRIQAVGATGLDKQTQAFQGSTLAWESDPLHAGAVAWSALPSNESSNVQWWECGFASANSGSQTAFRWDRLGSELLANYVRALMGPNATGVDWNHPVVQTVMYFHESVDLYASVAAALVIPGAGPNNTDKIKLKRVVRVRIHYNADPDPIVVAPVFDYGFQRSTAEPMAYLGWEGDEMQVRVPSTPVGYFPGQVEMWLPSRVSGVGVVLQGTAVEDPPGTVIAVSVMLPDGDLPDSQRVARGYGMLVKNGVPLPVVTNHATIHDFFEFWLVEPGN